MREGVDAPIDLVVAQLRSQLGAPLLAYIAGVRETRVVHEWAIGLREIKDGVSEQRLRVTLRVVSCITEHASPEIAQAWFQGLNPELDDCSPARLLREAEDVEGTGRAVLAAARAFGPAN